MKYRKKPVVIEAKRLTHQNVSEVQAWCQGQTWSRQPTRMVTGLQIHTLEGTMCAEYGDWIIKGVKGEFYPCKPDIFEASYEPVQEEQQQSQNQNLRNFQNMFGRQES